MLGAIIGDIVGSRWEFNPTNNHWFELLSDRNSFTDDTICTVAVADALLKGRDYGESLHEWCRKYPHPMGGYGGRFAQWVKSDNPKPYGSFGNGSAMRVSPIGFWFEDDNDILEHARRSAACTHDHEEGIRGAQTVALTIHHALALRKEILRGEEGMNQLMAYATGFSNYNIDIRKEDVENRFDETCQGTVPVALWIISQSYGFEDAIRRAVSLGADADTLGAIVGGMAEAIWGIPVELRSTAEAYLPEDMMLVINDFYQSEHNHFVRLCKRRTTQFIQKYIDFFENEFGRTRESFYRFFDDSEFSHECWVLGFDMDCGSSFSETYGLDAWYEPDPLKACIDKVDDIQVIGNALFSKWRYYNHWESPSQADEKTKEWFLLLLHRMKDLEAARTLP
ncbi:MAG: ADP-ribosylglycohydrolase family protein [Bacteroidales bacterium]|nr:ADP-ribosylglycohydrolase family protein [Bacteroidales bacterium]